MDLFVWIFGCLLAFLWSASVKGEEGGKFDTSFRPAEVLTVNRAPFLGSPRNHIDQNSSQRRNNVILKTKKMQTIF